MKSVKEIQEIKDKIVEKNSDLNDAVLYGKVASKVFDVKEKDVTPRMRAFIKEMIAPTKSMKV